MRALIRVRDDSESLRGQNADTSENLGIWPPRLKITREIEIDPEVKANENAGSGMSPQI